MWDIDGHEFLAVHKCAYPFKLIFSKWIRTIIIVLMEWEETSTNLYIFVANNY